MSRSRSLYLEHSDNSEHPTSNEMCCEALGIKCAVVLCWKTISTFCNNHKGGEVFSTWRNLASDTIFSGNNEIGAKGAFTIPDIEIKSWTIDRCRCKYFQNRNIFYENVPPAPVSVRAVQCWCYFECLKWHHIIFVTSSVCCVQTNV